MVSEEETFPPMPKGFPLNAASNISACAAALHVYFNLLGKLSGGTPSRREEPIRSSARTKLLTRAAVKEPLEVETQSD